MKIVIDTANEIENLKIMLETLTDDKDRQSVRFAINLIEGFEQQPTGEWIIDGHHRRCKKCSEYFCMADSEGNVIPSNFCPNCGAKMDNYHYSVPNLGGGTLSV